MRSSANDAMKPAGTYYLGQYFLHLGMIRGIDLRQCIRPADAGQ